jgi:hypothetical protein
MLEPVNESINVDEFDAQTLLELADLTSDDPMLWVDPSSPHTFFYPGRGQSFYVESIGCSYNPTQDTLGAEEKLKDYIAIAVPHGIPVLMERFSERMFAPILTPYRAVNEHLIFLDLDAKQLRECLSYIFSNFGDEECARAVISGIDFTLRLFAITKERIVIRRNIAAFREEREKCGLKLGLNDTLEYMHRLVVRERGIPSEANWRKVRKLFSALFAFLEEFREEFDVFDDSEATVVEVEDIMVRAEQWLEWHKPVTIIREQSLEM